MHKRQLLLFIGKLSFAAKVIPAGRILLHQLLDIAHSVDKLEKKFSVDQEALQDIEWWLKLSANWNGKAFSGGKVDSSSTPTAVHRSFWYYWLWCLLGTEHGLASPGCKL